MLRRGGRPTCSLVCAHWPHMAHSPPSFWTSPVDMKATGQRSDFHSTTFTYQPLALNYEQTLNQSKKKKKWMIPTEFRSVLFCTPTWSIQWKVSLISYWLYNWQLLNQLLIGSHQLNWFFWGGEKKALKSCDLPLESQCLSRGWCPKKMKPCLWCL